MTTYDLAKQIHKQLKNKHNWTLNGNDSKENSTFSKTSKLVYTKFRHCFHDEMMVHEHSPTEVVKIGNYLRIFTSRC